MSKDDLRRRMRRIRRDLADRPEQSARITERVLVDPDIVAANTIFCFVSVRAEVNTRDLLEALGDRVLVPRITGRGTMEAVPLGKLVAGQFGVPTCEGPAWDGPIDVALCPGLAFTSDGARLGYGGAYYDRFLASVEPVCIGLAFREQMVDSVPVEAHDRRMDRVITG